MAAFTVWRTAGRTFRPPLMTRETVPRDTPASRATSSIVGRGRGRPAPRRAEGGTGAS
jgi:hypothetical protein